MTTVPCEVCGEEVDARNRVRGENHMSDDMAEGEREMRSYRLSTEPTGRWLRSWERRGNDQAPLVARAELADRMERILRALRAGRDKWLTSGKERAIHDLADEVLAAYDAIKRGKG